jgi:hypothetical protein
MPPLQLTSKRAAQRRENSKGMVRITGGKVYDPANGVDGVVKDICIADDGRIVAGTNGSSVRTIDAAGMVIFQAATSTRTWRARLILPEGSFPRISASPGSSCTRPNSVPASAA